MAVYLACCDCLNCGGNLASHPFERAAPTKTELDAVIEERTAAMNEAILRGDVPAKCPYCGAAFGDWEFRIYDGPKGWTLADVQALCVREAAAATKKAELN
jgi:hypothetical protein